MSVENTYKTVRIPAEGIFKEKGSKFIAFAVPCYNEQEAKYWLEKWRKEHYQARHVCYAYRFGVDKKTFRANDDGEPNNSAGIPILGQIQSYDLSNILIAVVRYFGGVKLGVGGLVQAYKTAAKDALENAEIVEMEVFNWVKLTFSYNEMPFVMKWLKKFHLEMKEQDFQEICTLVTNLSLADERMRSELDELEGITIDDLGVY